MLIFCSKDCEQYTYKNIKYAFLCFSYYASTVGFSTGSAVSATHLVVPSVKRQRLSSSSSRAMKNGTKVNGNNNNNGTNYVIPHIPENSLKVYSK